MASGGKAIEMTSPLPGAGSAGATAATRGATPAATAGLIGGGAARSTDVEERVTCNNWWKLAPKCCSCYPTCFPATQLRKAVSQKKHRFTADGFDLDLRYLTDRIIAFGYPSIGMEHMYRNPRSECRRFFETYHSEHYFVYNLCCETGRSYPSSVFQGRVERYPFADHGVPTLDLMLAGCQSMQRWMDADRKNVVGIHCKAGKGRTGLLACCMFIHSGAVPNWVDAIAYYNRMRIVGGKQEYRGKGLTVPSQKRYVMYYQTVLEYAKQNKKTPEPTRKLKRVTYHNARNKRGSIRVYEGNDASNLVFQSDVRDDGVFEVGAAGSGGVDVTGDCLVEFRKEGKKLKYDIWFNTGFIGIDKDSGDPEGELIRPIQARLGKEVADNTLIIPKLGIDKLKKDFKDKKEAGNMYVQCDFEPLPKPVEPPKPSPADPVFEGGAQACVVLRHHVHTRYCDRKVKVCEADGRFREGELLAVVTKDDKAEVETVAWYRSDLGETLPAPVAAKADEEGDGAAAAGAGESKADGDGTALLGGDGDGGGGSGGAGAAVAGPFPPDEFADSKYGIVFRRITDKDTALPEQPPPEVRSDPAILSSADAAKKFVSQTAVYARRMPTVYQLRTDDTGRLLTAVVKLKGVDTVLEALPVGPAEAAPPKVREVNVVGEAKVGATLRAEATYFGGVEGASEYWWVCVEPDGTRTDLTEPRRFKAGDAGAGAGAGADDPRAYTLTAADVGRRIKAKVVPVREDGAKGYDATSKPTQAVVGEGGAEAGADGGDGGGAAAGAAVEDASAAAPAAAAAAAADAAAASEGKAAE